MSIESRLPLQRLYRWEKERTDRIFLTQPIKGMVREWTWAQALDEARRMAAYIIAQDWPPGSRIVILSKNCAWWMMAEVAIWMAGHTTVPIYPSLAAASVRKLVDHCVPVACFIGSVEDARMLSDGIPAGIARIAFPTAAGSSAASTWESIVAATPPLPGNPVRAADDIATIIYTSGTTGAPKGAMHRFAAFIYFAEAVTRVVGENSDERVLSYLPLAHIAERALVEAASIYVGGHVFFVESIATFQADLLRARPTLFFTVPRLLAKFQQGVLQKIPQRRLELLLRTPLLNTFVRRRILRQLGLDSARLSASGGAPLPLGTLEWFHRIGLRLVEGYGMTETGITHTPDSGLSRPGYVGSSVPGVETRVSATGEVEVRSPMNMAGYYRDPEGTRNAFTEDGFFCTGDLGELTSDGWLRIIGRAKEQFKTSKGKYVSPSQIEQLLSADPGVEASCVMGAGAPSPFAVILLANTGQDAAGREADLEALLEQVNSHLDAHEQLQFLVVTDEPWTVANGLLTPTMKIKRSVVEQYYAAYFEEWPRRKAKIIWHTSKERSCAP